MLTEGPIQDNYEMLLREAVEKMADFFIATKCTTSSREDIILFLTECDQELLDCVTNLFVFGSLYRLGEDSQLCVDGETGFGSITPARFCPKLNNVSQKTEKMIFMELLIHIRSFVLLSREGKVFDGDHNYDPLSILRARFPMAIAHQLVSYYIPVPERINQYLTAQELTSELPGIQALYEEIDRTFGGMVEAYGIWMADCEREQEVEDGVDPRLAERRANIKRNKALVFENPLLGVEELAYAMELRKNLPAFLLKYPDPRVLIDVILNTRDGKIPV